MSLLYVQKAFWSTTVVFFSFSDRLFFLGAG